MSQNNRPRAQVQLWEPVPHDWLDSVPLPPTPAGPGRWLAALLVAALFIVPALAAVPLWLVNAGNESKKLDQEARAAPLIIEGEGFFNNSDTEFWMTVAGTRLNLTESFYYGLTADANVTSEFLPVYILAAYLPVTKQTVEAQVYDKKGGKLLALFAERPDPQVGYKSALYDRYPQNNLWILWFYVPAALVMILLGIFFARRVYRGRKSG